MVNWKVGQKKWFGRRYRKIEAWKKTTERGRDITGTCALFTFHWNPTGRTERNWEVIFEDIPAKNFQNWSKVLSICLSIEGQHINGCFKIFSPLSFSSLKILKVFCNFTTTCPGVDYFCASYLGFIVFPEIED